MILFRLGNREEREEGLKYDRNIILCYYYRALDFSTRTSTSTKFKWECLRLFKKEDTLERFILSFFFSPNS